MSSYEDKSGRDKRGVVVKVYNGNIEGAIAQLKRKSNLEGINKELRRRRYFETNTERRRRKLAEAQIRWKKRWNIINEVPKPKRKTKKGQQRAVARPETTKR